MRNVVADLIEDVFEQCRHDTSGSVADYIPELAAADPDGFALCVATSDGYVYAVGDADTPFTIQSMSKPFTYGLALSECGRDAVRAKIDVEPSGEPFNEISLDPVTGRPRNPMINAGAITAASLVPGADVVDRFELIRQKYSRYAGRELSLNPDVYLSEHRTGHRNRAIGHMLRSFDIVTGDPDEAVDLYFRQCSIDVTCRDLAMMAATLANNGRNPCTGIECLSPEGTQWVLSVMTTCGLYDGAGAWAAHVGLPAKSGVSGGVLAVLPGQVGVAVYSPRLDRHGNSVRGVAAARMLSRELELHFLHVTREARSTIRSSYSVAHSSSRQLRTDAQQQVLGRYGHRGRVYELHGDLLFAGTEIAVREITECADDLDALLIDCRRVEDVSDIATRLIARMRHELVAQGCVTALLDPAMLLGSAARDDADFADRDAAIQWCEDVVLARHGGDALTPPPIRLADHPLLAGLPVAQFALLSGEFEIRSITSGTVILHRGSARAGLFLLLTGQVSMMLIGEDGSAQRISTIVPGMSFGEFPMLTHGRALTDIRAETDVRLAVLVPERYDRLAAEAPDLERHLLERLAATAYRQLDAAVRVLSMRQDVG